LVGYPWLTVEQKEMARRMRAKGLPLKAIVRAVGSTTGGICDVVNNKRVSPGQPFGWTPGPGRLSLEEREEILLGLIKGESMSDMGRRLGRATSTITREVRANGGPESYRAWAAHCRAREQARRPKRSKLASCPQLRQQVTDWLEEWWSPDEISQRLRAEFPDNPMMRVSHETIYRSLFVQGRGELRRELARCLRSGRATRRARGRTDTRGQLPEKVMISERPAEASDRAVPGHWEGDLIVGARNRSAVGTLVERSTRYVMLLHLADGYTAASVDKAMRDAITTLPSELFRSVTWDQGTEMSRHQSFTVDTGVQIYFCDPHAPWQRGSNENTNGLLRQYMPKGTDLSVLTPDDLARIARSLNNRPRKTLGYVKPSEKLAEFLALTG
jgi:IS30 family transposase